MSTSIKREREANGAAPPPKRSKTNYQEVIYVLVGPEETPFIVHSAAICAKSRYFQTTCSGEWKEAKEKTIRLPDMTPWEFAVYIHYVYTGEIDNEGSGMKAESPFHLHNGIHDVYDAGLCMFLVANALQDEEARNLAITRLINTERNEVSLSAGCHIRAVWKRTTDKSALRRWLIDTFAAISDPGTFVGDDDRYSGGFLMAVAQKLAAARMGIKLQVPTLANACQYHEHEDTVKCPDEQ